jgi:hypothetical protein
MRIEESSSAVPSKQDMLKKGESVFLKLKKPKLRTQFVRERMYNPSPSEVY